ncbi:hypothetical protein GCM10009111_06520 [Colwellia asteriadis]|uniref:Uncharacterized protein n=1 Tax=Colwellia asteriadis TaxID=517723 RepID=A0ABN1L3R8_9GAMM
MSDPKVILQRSFKIGTALNYLHKVFFRDEKNANKLYLAIYPTLKSTVQSKGRNLQDAIALLEALADAAPFRAKSRNFKRRYVERADGWRSLPKDPNQIPYGYWH